MIVGSYKYFHTKTSVNIKQEQRNEIDPVLINIYFILLYRYTLKHIISIAKILYY